MDKSRIEPLKKKVVYQSEKVVRWGLCMKIATTLYKSNFTTNYLEAQLSDIEENI